MWAVFSLAAIFTRLATSRDLSLKCGQHAILPSASTHSPSAAEGPNSPPRRIKSCRRETMRAPLPIADFAETNARRLRICTAGRNTDRNRNNSSERAERQTGIGWTYCQVSRREEIVSLFFFIRLSVFSNEVHQNLWVPKSLLIYSLVFWLAT